MGKILILDQITIDKIAAGEVIERPASVVKELVENAVDAGATAVTVEIKEGGISFIRITDNGAGIPKEEVQTAFLRHATSKIRSAGDLFQVSSLGFRGEALSSISAVSQVELISKTSEELLGCRYVIEGGAEKSIEEIGAPQGTTFLVRNLFFNTPVRKKFLKSAQTEAGYISDLMERMALSHSDVSFKFINNNQVRMHTSGNTNLKDIIYGVYGRDIANQLIEINAEKNGMTLTGYIGKPVVSRGNRNYENYYVNGRYVKSKIIAKGIEEAYKTFMMQHKYPFTALHLHVPSEEVDVNVHPTKMEVRFMKQQAVYEFVCEILRDALAGRELIPEVSLDRKVEPEKQKLEPKASIPEPFEVKRRSALYPGSAGQEKTAAKPVMHPEVRDIPGKVPKVSAAPPLPQMVAEDKAPYAAAAVEPVKNPAKPEERPPQPEEKAVPEEKLPTGEQMSLVSEEMLGKELLTQEARKEHRIIGQLFDTYWMVEYQEKLYIIDQHAAHEKVLYERTMKNLEKKEHTSQMISPPILLSLSMLEEELLKAHMEYFEQIGFAIEHFGGREYSIRAVPDNLFGVVQSDLFMEILAGLEDQGIQKDPTIIMEKVASMSCKAAVKGRHRMSALEAETLIDELLTLDNPYNCPHGRPTIISMTRYELEKKFKRIV